MTQQKLEQLIGVMKLQLDELSNAINEKRLYSITNDGNAILELAAQIKCCADEFSAKNNSTRVRVRISFENGNDPLANTTTEVTK